MDNFSLTKSEKIACLRGFDLAVDFFRLHVEAQEIHKTASAAAFKEVLSQYKLVREKLETELDK